MHQLELKMPQAAAKAICRFVPPFLRFLREGLNQVGLSPARFQVMQALKEEGALSMVDLAERLSVTKRNVTSLVDGLEKDGLAARNPHPNDRRSTLVALTAEGDEVYCLAAEVQRKHLATLVDRLNETQRYEMAQALNHLTNVMTENAVNKDRQLAVGKVR